MKLISVVGARPQFIKLKPICEVLKYSQHEHVIIHTGQHYDTNLSDIFFKGLEIPEANFNLYIGSGSHAEQTGKMMIKLEQKILNIKPDWVLVYGDTNSTLAGALASSKLNIPVVHIESGLRSFNRAMPEEINRVLTDHASDILFAPTKLAMQNLSNEGLAKKSYFVGDVMADLFEILTSSSSQDSIISLNDYFVTTIHRPFNTDNRDQLNRILKSLIDLETKVLLIAHPRLISAMERFRLTKLSKNIEILNPLGYIEMIELIKSSRGVITDSGGIQKEVYLLGKPCITIRSETEWPETLQGSMNVLAPLAENLKELVDRKIVNLGDKPFGDGYASRKIIDILSNHFSGHAL